MISPQRNSTTKKKKLGNGKALEYFLSELPKATRGVCLIWPHGKAGNSYGTLTVKGKKTYAHHLAWIHTFGQIPEGQHVLHHCDTPSCFNPYCLFLGTEQDNKDDQKRKGRTMMGELNGVARLTNAAVIEIRTLHPNSINGLDEYSLAKRFGVHPITIRRVVERETWKHL